jgi:hypothetical protein
LWNRGVQQVAAPECPDVEFELYQCDGEFWRGGGPLFRGTFESEAGDGGAASYCYWAFSRYDSCVALLAEDAEEEGVANSTH